MRKDQNIFHIKFEFWESLSYTHGSKPGANGFAPRWKNRFSPVLGVFHCVIYFFSVASTANANINSIESHWSSCPMSSSRFTINGIQTTLSSQNLYTEVMNSQSLAYQVLNSSSYKSGQENFTTSGQITESMYNISPIFVLDLSKHSAQVGAIMRTIQVRLTNLSKQTKKGKEGRRKFFFPSPKPIIKLIY
jgi:hypothetical protein